MLKNWNDEQHHSARSHGPDAGQVRHYPGCVGYDVARLLEDIEWQRYHLKVKEDENQVLRKLVARLREEIVDMRAYK